MHQDHLIYAPSIAQALRCECRAKWSNLTQGRSNRVWRRMCPCGDLTVKVYDDAAQSALFRNDPKAEWHVLKSLCAADIVPEPKLKFEHSTGAVISIFEYVIGQRWRQNPSQAAVLLNQISSRSFPDLPTRAISSEVCTQIVECLLYKVPAQVAQNHLALRPKTPLPPSDKLGLVHGDFTPSNILVHENGIMAIDWQSPWHGDPVLDVGLFLSPSMQFHSMGRRLTKDEIDAFLGALDEPHLPEHYEEFKPWCAWVMAAYALWRVYAKQDETAHKDYDLEMTLLRICS